MLLRTIKVEYMGESLTIPQWRDKLGLKLSSYAIYYRIFKANWPVEEAFRHEKFVRPEVYTVYDLPLLPQVIDRGVESYNELMISRGYFRKENRIRRYKMLNALYKEFQAEDKKAA